LAEERVLWALAGDAIAILCAAAALLSARFGLAAVPIAGCHALVARNRAGAVGAALARLLAVGVSAGDAITVAGSAMSGQAT